MDKSNRKSDVCVALNNVCVTLNKLYDLSFETIIQILYHNTQTYNQNLKEPFRKNTIQYINLWLINLKYNIILQYNK